MLHFLPVEIWISSGKSLMTDWNFAIAHWCADTTVWKEHYLTQHRFCGSSEHLPAWRRENRLINFSMEDIQRFLLDMQDFTSVWNIWQENPIQIRMLHHLHWMLWSTWTMHVTSGKRRRTLLLVSMVHRLKVQPISSQNVCRRDLVLFRELQIRVILQTAIMYLSEKRLMLSQNWSLNLSSRHFLPVEPSAM